MISYVNFFSCGVLYRVLGYNALIMIHVRILDWVLTCYLHMCLIIIFILLLNVERVFHTILQLSLCIRLDDGYTCPISKLTQIKN